METKKIQKTVIIKASIFIVFIITAIVIVRYTAVKRFLTVDQLGRILEAVGFWAPLAFIAIYALGGMPVRSRYCIGRFGRYPFWGLLGLCLCLGWGDVRSECCLFDRPSPWQRVRCLSNWR